MATSLRVFETWSTAPRAVVTNLSVALPFAAFAALVTAPFDAWLTDAIAGVPPRQEDLLSVALAWSGWALLAEVLFGPLFAAAAVCVAANHARGVRVGLYKAVNFAFNRYRRMFLPHLGAQVSIQLGMLVLVPGVLYMCMYAFVDPVACLEDEKWPMARSKRLTRGRRKTILWVALPMVLLSLVRMFTDMWALGQGPVWFLADYTAVYLLQFWLWAGFTHMYLKRVAVPEAESRLASKPMTPAAAPEA